MKIESDIKLDFDNVYIRPKRSVLSSRSEVDLTRTFVFKHRTWSGIPIFASNMDTTGTIEMAVELSKHKMLTAIHKHYSLNDWRRWRVFYADKVIDTVFNYIAVSMGISDEDFEKTKEILITFGDRIPFIMLDVANGYSENFVTAVKRAVIEFPEKTIIAGNVVTREMTEALILAGAEIIKIGLGSGKACCSTVVTGVGYPQLSAVMECADAAHGLNAFIISDGGCKTSGDIAKAFGGGADFVMMGGMFAGHKESGGEIVTENGKMYKMFYGMSSDTAMKKYRGGVAAYRASEGKTLKIEYKGDVNDTVLSILGGLRSTCTYIGASCIKYLPKCCTFIRVS